MIKLVATDLDGTFLNEAGAFDREKLHDILGRFQKEGILFTAASGRSLLALERLFGDYKDKMAFIAENGSVVKLFGDIAYEACLKPEQYLKIADKLLESPYMKGYNFLLSGANGAYLHEKADTAYVDFIGHYYEKVQTVPDFSHIDDQIFKFTANFTEETVREGETWVNQTFDEVVAVTTGFKSIDIILKKVNKRTGLEHLCEKYGISSQEVLAFGDNINDLEMLEFAGTAIATANAREEIKAISTQVIGSCEDGAVMSYMERMVN